MISAGRREVGKALREVDRAVQRRQPRHLPDDGLGEARRLVRGRTFDIASIVAARPGEGRASPARDQVVPAGRAARLAGEAPAVRASGSPRRNDSSTNRRPAVTFSTSWRCEQEKINAAPASGRYSCGPYSGNRGLATLVVPIEVEREREAPVGRRGAQVVSVGLEESTGRRVVAADLESLEPGGSEREGLPDLQHDPPAERGADPLIEFRVGDDVIPASLELRPKCVLALAARGLLDAGLDVAAGLPGVDQLRAHRIVERVLDEQHGCLRGDLEGLGLRQGVDQIEDAPRGVPAVVQRECVEDPKVRVEHECRRRIARPIARGDLAIGVDERGKRRDGFGVRLALPNEMDAHVGGDAIAEAVGELTDRRRGGVSRRGGARSARRRPSRRSESGCRPPPGERRSGARCPRPRIPFVSVIAMSPSAASIVRGPPAQASCFRPRASASIASTPNPQQPPTHVTPSPSHASAASARERASVPASPSHARAVASHLPPAFG